MARMGEKPSVKPAMAAVMGEMLEAFGGGIYRGRE